MILQNLYCLQLEMLLWLSFVKCWDKGIQTQKQMQIVEQNNQMVNLSMVL